MADRTIYDTTVPSTGSRMLAHERIIRVKIGGVFRNITGDANNLNPTPTPVTINSEVYGNKGLPSMQKIGDSYVITFSVEGVRTATGEIVPAQQYVRELLKIGRRSLEANIVEAQWFDALDDDLPAFQGQFRVEWVDGNTNYSDGGVWNFTLTSQGVVEEITSPIAGTGEPVLESATPTGAAAGDLIVVRGYKLTSAVSATIKAVAVEQLRVVDDNTVVLTVPEAVTGSAPIIVTNAAGASAPLPYQAAA